MPVVELRVPEEAAEMTSFVSEPEWRRRQAHHDATNPVWEGPAQRGRRWDQECRDALKKTGHSAMAYENCVCRGGRTK